MVWIMPTATIVSAMAILPKPLILSKNLIKGIQAIEVTVPAMVQSLGACVAT